MTATAPVREIGYAQEAYTFWQYDGETTPELIWPQSVQVYDEMRRQDAQVASVLRAVTLPVRRTPWRIDPHGARDEVVELVAADLNLPIVGEDVPHRVGRGLGGQATKPAARLRDRFSWPEHLREALLMLVFGHSYFEMVYRVDKDANRAHLHKLAPRPARTIQRVDVADDGGLIAIVQYSSRTSTVQTPIPVNRLVAYVHDREGGNWLGTSLLRPAYKHWLIKDRLLRVQAQTIERNGMGIPLYKGQENASAADLEEGKVMATLWRAGEAAGSAVPFGADLVLRGVEGTLPDANPAIRYHDEQIARAVLAHFLNLGTQTGSWALGTTFADFFTLSLQTLAQQVADTATMHVIEDLVDANWGEDEPAPRLVFDEIGSRQAATAQALKSLIDAGAIQLDATLEEVLRQQYGLPPRDPETAKAAEDEAVDADAMGAAIDDFLGGNGRVTAAAKWNPQLHPRGSEGRFRTTFDRLLGALKTWQAAGAKGDPFKDFQNREPLRRAAVAQGIKLRRGATRDEIADALLAHIRGGLAGKGDGKGDSGGAAPAPVKKATPAKKAAKPKTIKPADLVGADLDDIMKAARVGSPTTEEGRRALDDALDDFDGTNRQDVADALRERADEIDEDAATLLDDPRDAPREKLPGERRDLIDDDFQRLHRLADALEAIEKAATRKPRAKKAAPVPKPAERLAEALKSAGWTATTAPGSGIVSYFDPGNEREIPTPDYVTRSMWPGATYTHHRMVKIIPGGNGRPAAVLVREHRTPWVMANERKVSYAAAIDFVSTDPRPAAPAKKAAPAEVPAEPAAPKITSPGLVSLGGSSYSETPGIRPTLKGAETTDDVSLAYASEVQRITGRTVRVSFQGSDVRVARELAEGLLRAHELFPRVRVDQIAMYGGADGRPDLNDERVAEAYAWAGLGASAPDSTVWLHTIAFNVEWAGDPDRYRAAVDHDQWDGFSVAPRGSGVISTAIHEFGHKLAAQTKTSRRGLRIAEAHAKAAGKGKDVTRHIKRAVSTYAATDQEELMAEAFADVMLNGAATDAGGGASELSRMLFEEMERRYRKLRD